MREGRHPVGSSLPRSRSGEAGREGTRPGVEDLLVNQRTGLEVLVVVGGTVAVTCSGVNRWTKSQVKTRLEEHHCMF